MKSKFTYLLLAVLALNSCSKDSKTDDLPTNTCGVTNPVKDLTWLKETVAAYEFTELKNIFIWQTEYQAETIFVVGTCKASIDPHLGVFDCEGNEISITNELTDYLNSVTSKYIIWKPENFECNV